VRARRLNYRAERLAVDVTARYFLRRLRDCAPPRKWIVRAAQYHGRDGSRATPKWLPTMTHTSHPGRLWGSRREHAPAVAAVVPHGWGADSMMSEAHFAASTRIVLKVWWPVTDLARARRSDKKFRVAVAAAVVRPSGSRQQISPSSNRGSERTACGISSANWGHPLNVLSFRETRLQGQPLQKGRIVLFMAGRDRRTRCLPSRGDDAPHPTPTHPCR
jgi:hypothetical protein